MKLLLASIAIASLSVAALAQTAAPVAKPAAKPAAKAAAKPAAKPGSKTSAKSQARREAIEVATPLEEDDPSDKLSAAELEVAKRVHVGEIKCELGAQVKVTARKREGYFLVTHGINRFVMHPVESKTGAIRLEDTARGALWLQLGNKSMLMNQKEGKRLADECASAVQVDFAKNMKPVNLLEPAPAEAAPTAAATAAATPTAAAAAAAVTPTAAAPAEAAPAAATPTAAAPVEAAPAAAPAAPDPTPPAAAAPSAAPAPAQ